MLGRAQNPDGSLKEAKEIDWRQSASPPRTQLNSIQGRKRGLTREPEIQVQKKVSSLSKNVRNVIGLSHPSRPMTAAARVQAAPQRLNLTLHDKITVLDYIESKEGQGKSQKEIVQHFSTMFPGLKQHTISRIKHDSMNLRLRVKDNNQLSFKRPRMVVFPEVEMSLSSWLIQSQARGVQVTSELIRVKARLFADLHGIDPNNFLSLSNS